jgi:sulfide:quinone oxidoreductase
MIRMRRPRVVLVGGGFGGLEAAFYLRKRLGGDAEIELISDRSDFVNRPSTIYIPFGLDPARVRVPLEAPMRRQDILFVRAAVTDVDPQHQTVRADGQLIGYDYLILATGASMRPAEIPGLAQYAHSPWTPEGMVELGGGFQELARGGHERQRVLFVLPPNSRCASPMYELVFMLDTWLRREGARGRVQLSWATDERAYLQAFGPRMDEVITEQFRRRCIEGHKGLAVVGVEPGLAYFRNGEKLPYDLLVAFPPHVAATAFPELPADERGFVRTELETRQVFGNPSIYAVGDASDFPVKQAHLAILQAGAAAEHIAAGVLGEEPRTVFEPVSMCVLEQLDTATFARAPLRATDQADKPIVVATEDPGYRVGTSPAWRMGKKLMGAYVPWRFGAGEPFYGGVPWLGMDAGLALMSRTLAE